MSEHKKQGGAENSGIVVSDQKGRRVHWRLVVGVILLVVVVAGAILIVQRHNQSSDSVPANQSASSAAAQQQRADADQPAPTQNQVRGLNEQ